MISGAELSLWLRSETEQKAGAIDDLVTAGDLAITEDDVGGFALIRSHDRVVTMFEIGALPMLRNAYA